MQTSAIKPVKLYNTLTRSVDEFTTIEPGHVRLYCCGPTVYNFQHIGNLRTYLFEDVLVRALKYAGYSVTHCMNITDVGHLVSDADDGEDKMAVAMKREGKRSYEIADYYTKIFFDHCSWLHINRPNIVCKATEHIPQMIELAQKLESNGIAYFSEGNLYYDVAKFADYGKLARLDLSSLQAGARIDVDSKKRNPYDFVLWFTQSKFENQELQWDSPWGRGYPGWHIECSAMSKHHLGEQIDIHCGGIDHIPVHHTNEIAQSEGASGKQFATFWVHGGWLVVGKEKMSKSTGGFLTLDKVAERGLDPLSYRLFCLSGSYRNELAWSWEALEAASNALTKLKASIIELKKQVSKEQVENASLNSNLIAEFDDAILNDLNMPKAMALVYKVLGAADLLPSEKLKLLYVFDQVLGLDFSTWEEEEVEIPQEVLSLLQAREDARKSKNWAEADRLRDEVLSLGYTIEDSKDGARVKRKK